ncbi:MAG: hypothetical protein J6Y31_03285 [Bacteroidales bacterium]|nr:hypothetical protein [Bacteroidales bacterium]
MRRYINILYCVALVTALAGCQGKEAVPQVYSDEYIRFFSGGTTRAILDGSNALDYNGTTSTIYDYLTDFEGTIMSNGVQTTHTSSDVFKYFSDGISYPGGNGAWNYTSGTSYRWTRTGTHNFFGWMTADGSSGLTTNGFFGAAPSFDESTRVLTLPSKTLTTASDQYDFLYSEVRQETEASAGGNPVPLLYKHLFSALKIEIQNVSDNAEIVKSVQTAFIYNTKTASIDFSTGEVSYSGTSQSNIIPALASDVTLNKNDGMFLWGDEYKLIWPQTPSEIESAKILINYCLASAPDETITSTIELKNVRVGGRLLTETGIEAGKKYYFLLQFKNGSIDLDISVKDWYYSESVLDFSNTSISAQSGNNTPFEGILWLYHEDGTTITKDVDRKLTMVDAQEIIRGEFYVASPYNGRWQVSMFPMDAAGYFVIEPNSGDITRDMVENDNGRVQFYVRANHDIEAPASAQTVHFTVSIYFGNEWHDANSEFNRKDFRLVRNPN